MGDMVVATRLGLAGGGHGLHDELGQVIGVPVTAVRRIASGATHSYIVDSWVFRYYRRCCKSAGRLYVTPDQLWARKGKEGQMPSCGLNDDKQDSGARMLRSLGAQLPAAT